MGRCVSEATDTEQPLLTADTRRCRSRNRRRRRASPPRPAAPARDRAPSAAPGSPANASDSAAVSPTRSASSTSRRRARVRDQPLAVRRDFYRSKTSRRPHHVGVLLGRGRDLEQSRFSRPGRTFPRPRPQPTIGASRLAIDHGKTVAWHTGRKNGHPVREIRGRSSGRTRWPLTHGNRSLDGAITSMEPDDAAPTLCGTVRIATWWFTEATERGYRARYTGLHPYDKRAPGETMESFPYTEKGASLCSKQSFWLA